uniref:Uncharacterized protein n=1 Tax=Streptomyces auratus AGR0001 TaxID=1160718 RepID=J2JVY4_9ACTN
MSMVAKDRTWLVRASVSGQLALTSFGWSCSVSEGEVGVTALVAVLVAERDDSCRCFQALVQPTRSVPARFVVPQVGQALTTMSEICLTYAADRS